MKSKVKKGFESQVQRLADQAQDMIYEGTDPFWGSTYVDGVGAALDWVLGGGEERETPLSHTPKLALANEVGKVDLENALKTVISALSESRNGDGQTLARLAANEDWFNHVCKLVGIKPEDFDTPKAV